MIGLMSSLAHLSPSPCGLPLAMAAGFPQAMDLRERQRAQGGHHDLLIVLEVRFPSLLPRSVS